MKKIILSFLSGVALFIVGLFIYSFLTIPSRPPISPEHPIRILFISELISVSLFVIGLYSYDRSRDGGVEMKKIIVSMLAGVIISSAFIGVYVIFTDAELTSEPREFGEPGKFSLALVDNDRNDYIELKHHTGGAPTVEISPPSNTEGLDWEEFSLSIWQGENRIIFLHRENVRFEILDKTENHAASGLRINIGERLRISSDKDFLEAGKEYSVRMNFIPVISSVSLVSSKPDNIVRKTFTLT